MFEMIKRLRAPFQSCLPVREWDTPASNSDTTLCATCTALDFKKILHDGLPDENMVPLGTLSDITNKRDRCGFCRLVADLVWDRWRLNEFPDTDLKGNNCFVSAHGCGALVPKLSERKEAHRFYIHASRPSDVTRALIAIQADLLLDIQLLQEDARKVSRSKDLHGRRVIDTVDIQLIKRWIQLCEEAHGESCRSVWWKSGSGDVPEFVRMVDVVEMSLVHAGRSCRYVALSYVWGGPGDDYWTTSANADTRSRQSGLDESVLPATIVDAIYVTRELGERYLWVDALCIIQDSQGDKAGQISIMDQIYGRAALTLIAADGMNARTGLSGVRQGSRTLGQHIECIQGLHLSIPLPPLREAIADSTWNTRGWTFQEDVMSRRRLYFTKHQVYFACSKDVWCEDLVAESNTLKGSFHPMRYMNTNFFPDDPRLISQWDCRGYQSAVAQYTQRRLTVESDIIYAITALTSVMTRTLEPAGSKPEDAFRFGMWIGYLDLSLLWQPQLNVVLSRRTVPSVEHSRWPSWAWSGWKGAVHYQHEAYLREGVDADVKLAPAESLVAAWNLVNEDGIVIRLDTKQISWSCRDEDNPSGRPPRMYAPTKGYPSDRSLGFTPPTGTLIFRTQCASFQVLKVDDSVLADPSAATAHTIFHIIPVGRASPDYAGRVILPVSTRSPTVLEFVVLSRCDGGSIGLWEESAWGKQYTGAMLNVMAVQKAREDARVNERVGVGVVVESAWMKSVAEERVVLLA